MGATPQRLLTRASFSAPRQCGHVVEHDREPGRAGLRCGKLVSSPAGSVPPLLLGAGSQGPPDRAQRRRQSLDLLERADGVGLGGRLHQPGMHQPLEGVIADDVEPDPAVGRLEDVPEQFRGDAGDDRTGRRRRRGRFVRGNGDLQVKLLLVEYSEVWESPDIAIRSQRYCRWGQQPQRWEPPRIAPSQTRHLQAESPPHGVRCTF